MKEKIENLIEKWKQQQSETPSELPSIYNMYNLFIKDAEDLLSSPSEEEEVRPTASLGEKDYKYGINITHEEKAAYLAGYSDAKVAVTKEPAKIQKGSI